MKFIVDNQLPVALARWLSARGEDAVHVLDLALDTTSDMDMNQGIKEMEGMLK